MKFITFVLLLMVQIYVMISMPVKEGLNLAERNSEQHLRVRRFTCDVLAIFGPGVTRSACGFHCLMLGKHGGDCQEAMCVCRKENILKTWNQQFGQFYKFQ
ncbi:defensin-like [Microplitis mediator]|uniref:defensin-like n=1 Tax=Microplitis mediator TaxID=375433 RepID=UPI00255743F8|nr:defensin-like [Microplitis mediator]